MNAPKRKKVITAVVFAVTIVLGVTALVLAWRLQQEKQVSEEEAKAASEEVTKADKLTSQALRDSFAERWADFESEEEKTWEDYVAFAIDDSPEGGARYSCDTEIMTVGKETLYGCDLNALFVLMDFETYTTTEVILASNTQLNTVLDSLITDSGILQLAEEEGILTLDETYFNSPDKDIITRYAQTSVARDAVGDQFVKKIDWEAIVIYFRNEIDPPYVSEDGHTLEEAMAVAKAKMDILYERMNSGEITMAQAGEEIANDNISGDETEVSLTKLDRLYAENAYVYSEGHPFGEGFFKDDVYDEELRSLGEGQMSTVRTCKDLDEDKMLETGEKLMVDSCYIVFKVNNIYFGSGEEETTVSGETQEDLEENIGNNYIVTYK